MLLHRAHRQDRRNHAIVLRRRAKTRRDPSPEIRIQDILLDFGCHAAGQGAVIDGEQLSCREYRELFRALVGYEEVAEILGVRVDEVACLAEDGEPDVVGAEGEVVVGAVAWSAA
jgi:hypothetical protein